MRALTPLAVLAVLIAGPAQRDVMATRYKPANGFIESAVDAMVTPMGLGAIIEGRKEWAYASNGFTQPDAGASTPGAQQEIDSRFESPSRFTATMRDGSGAETRFVLTRSGLNWKLSDIRLPP